MASSSTTSPSPSLCSSSPSDCCLATDWLSSKLIGRCGCKSHDWETFREVDSNCESPADSECRLKKEVNKSTVERELFTSNCELRGFLEITKYKLHLNDFTILFQCTHMYFLTRATTGTKEGVLIREVHVHVSFFQRVKCVVLLIWNFADVSSLERCCLWEVSPFSCISIHTYFLPSLSSRMASSLALSLFSAGWVMSDTQRSEEDEESVFVPLELPWHSP